MKMRLRAVENKTFEEAFGTEFENAKQEKKDCTLGKWSEVVCGEVYFYICSVRKANRQTNEQVAKIFILCFRGVRFDRDR